MQPLPPLSAFWIWTPQASYTPYQQAIFASKSFRLPAIQAAALRITADGQYRLIVNGEWVADGPCRSWPEHFQYDQIDLTPYLQEGQNELLVIARHWSSGTFHGVPQQAGLLAQLDLTLANGRTRRIVTDSSWQVAEARAWLPDTPRASIQMEPQEFYDARLEDDLSFAPAAELFAAEGGPWKDLHARDVALMARKPLAPRCLLAANLVRHAQDLVFCMPASRLANPGLVEANRSVGCAGGMATLLELDQLAEIRFSLDGFAVSVDGVTNPAGVYALPEGRHFVLAFSTGLFGHNKDRSLRLLEPPAGLILTNPLDPEHDNPWCRIDMPEYAWRGDDLVWPDNLNLDGERERLAARYEEETARLLKKVRNLTTFFAQLGPRARCMPKEEMFVRETHWPFINRAPIGPAWKQVDNPAAALHDNADFTTIHPAPEGDIELVYDLGEESVGYFNLDLIAAEGTLVDLYSVEYIGPNGEVQHTFGNANGMRYITREGANRFTSLKRRAGRYIFVTLRNQRAPLRLRLLQMIESTYPVNQQARFDCSDSRLGRIWEISARTLKLCMEDTFTDCPLYEQTYWVGDARNEAIFAYETFDAVDIARRCIRLAAQSLERYPITGCQVPSGWDCLLPAWSFLWGISVWDYYFYTGDKAFVAEVWPAVMRNLEGASGLLDERGLFSGPFWNMFDWSGIDDRHETVLHNSMLLVGAIQAAERLASVLGEAAHLAWLAGFRARLVESINRQWDPERDAFPDSFHPDGSASLSTSLHTSFLALLYDILPPDRAVDALADLLHPPENVVKVGSPFASLYLYEALEKSGQAEAVLAAIYQNYLPMLEAGATTVWEVFPASLEWLGGFPTRSHCHAWSAAPLHFLPRILLGIRPLEPGGGVVEISPRLGNLTWAKGAIATPRGRVEVSWQLEGKHLRIEASAPPGTRLQFAPNPDLNRLKVERNF